MRGAIRNRDYAGPYDIYLYSELQAQRIRDHLLRIGFQKIDLIPVDEAGIMEAVRSTVGRREPTPEEQAAKTKDRQDRDKKRKQDGRAEKAKAEGREPSANEGRGGRPTGSKDKQKRKPRAQTADA
jgi:hypothetical protein